MKIQSRIYLLIGFVAILFSSCDKSQSNNENVIIAGKILNQQNYPDNYTIKIFENNLVNFNGNTHTEFIEDNGSFKFKFEKSFSSDIYLNYGHLITLFVNPGDSIYIEMDADELFMQNRKNQYSLISLKFSGDSKQINEEINLFYSIISIVKIGREGSRNEKSMVPEDYVAYLEVQRKREHQILDSLSQAQNLSKLFVGWAQFDIDYRFSMHLFHYAWFNPTFGKKGNREFQVIDIPESFFKAIENIPIDNEKAIINNNYRMFLHEYFLTTSNYKSDFNKMRNKLGRKFFKSESFQNEFEKHLKFIQKEYTGIACEIIQSQKLYGLLDGINRVDVFENLYPNFKKELRNSFCNILDAKYIEVKLLENNEDDNNSLYKSENGIEGQANNILKKIIDQNKGKVIYIDFWAIWCGPCLKEFGYSKNVAKTFEGKKIEFVYCCVKSEKEKWEEKIRDYRLSGSQYLLNDSEYDVLSQKFQITGIPHYVLIDKNGKIIDKNAPRPSSGEELVNMINKYLN